jgi:hypothetical protein
MSGRDGRTAALLIPLIAAMVVAGIIGGIVLTGQSREIRRLEQQAALSRQQLADLESQRVQLRDRVEALLTERQTADERLNALRAQLSSATAELDQGRTTLSSLKERYDAVRETTERQETQLAGLTTERDQARRQARTLQLDHEDLTRALTRLRERLAWLDRDYRRVSERLKELDAARSQPQAHAPPSAVHAVTQWSPASPEQSSGFAAASPAAVVSEGASGSITRQTVELPPIIVTRDSGRVGPLQAMVLEIHEPLRFVILNRGSQDGVSVGMGFDIVRSGAVVGRVTVVRVRPTLSACDVVRPVSPGGLRVGDTAIPASS